MSGSARIVLAIIVGLGVIVGTILALVGQGRREREVRAVFFDLFVAALNQGGSPKMVGVEADWVAARLLGMVDVQLNALTQLPRGLDVEQTARWIETLAEVRWVGERLCAEGFCQPFAVQFDRARPGQRINPPPGLFMLAPRGQAWVLRESKRRRARDTKERTAR